MRTVTGLGQELFMALNVQRMPVIPIEIACKCVLHGKIHENPSYKLGLADLPVVLIPVLLLLVLFIPILAAEVYQPQRRVDLRRPRPS